MTDSEFNSKKASFLDSVSQLRSPATISNLPWLRVLVKISGTACSGSIVFASGYSKVTGRCYLCSVRPYCLIIAEVALPTADCVRPMKFALASGWVILCFGVLLSYVAPLESACVVSSCN